MYGDDGNWYVASNPTGLPFGYGDYGANRTAAAAPMIVIPAPPIKKLSVTTAFPPRRGESQDAFVRRYLTYLKSRGYVTPDEQRPYLQKVLGRYAKQFVRPATNRPGAMTPNPDALRPGAMTPNPDALQLDLPSRSSGSPRFPTMTASAASIAAAQQAAMAAAAAATDPGNIPFDPQAQGAAQTISESAPLFPEAGPSVEAAEQILSAASAESSAVAPAVEPPATLIPPPIEPAIQALGFSRRAMVWGGVALGAAIVLGVGYYVYAASR